MAYWKGRFAQGEANSPLKQTEKINKHLARGTMSMLGGVGNLVPAHEKTHKALAKGVIPAAGKVVGNMPAVKVTPAMEKKRNIKNFLKKALYKGFVDFPDIRHVGFGGVKKSDK